MPSHSKEGSIGSLPEPVAIASDLKQGPRMFARHGCNKAPEKIKMRPMVVLLLIFAGCLAGCPPATGSPSPCIEVCFSPKGGCTDAVARERGAAKRLVLIQAYLFTSAPIAKTLLLTLPNHPACLVPKGSHGALAAHRRVNLGHAPTVGWFTWDGGTIAFARWWQWP
jgi:hypothetical protein